jgi:hypothetical protein
VPTPKLRRAFLVSYHALPDPAVGGLRLSMLAEYLVQGGVEVILFSAPAPSVAGERVLDPRVRRRQIPDRKVITRALIALTRAMRGFVARARGRYPSSVSANPPRYAPAVEHSLSTIGRIRAHFFRIVGALDDHKWWSLKLLFVLFQEFLRERPSVLVVSGPPYSPMATTILFCKLTSTTALIDFRDPWSGRGQSAEYLGFRARLDSSLEALCVGWASAVTTTAPTLARALRMRYPTASESICDVLNGFDDEMLITVPPPRGGLFLLFAGTIYQNRSPMPLLAALARLVEMPGIDRANIRLTFVGSCSTWRGLDLPDWVRGNKLDDCVSFRGLVPRSEVARLTGGCNVLINLAQEQKWQIPAKLFEHVASGRAVLLFAEPDSDSATVSAGLVGVHRVDDDVDDVTSKLRALYLQFSENPARDKSVTLSPEPAFSRRTSNRRLVRILEQALVDES